MDWTFGHLSNVQVLPPASVPLSLKLVFDYISSLSMGKYAGANYMTLSVRNIIASFNRTGKFYGMDDFSFLKKIVLYRIREFPYECVIISPYFSINLISVYFLP